MQRRALLASLGGLAGASSLGGCLGGPGVSTPVPTSTPTSTRTPPPTETGENPVTPEETSFQVLSRACGSGESSASVTYGEDTVAVDGVIGGRDTCDTARLAKAELRGDVFTVVIERVEEEHTETPTCAQCLTDIEYSISATFPNEAPARVRVVHRTGDGESTVATADRP